MLGLAVFIVVIRGAFDSEDKDRNTVVDAHGNQIAMNLGGDPRLDVMWVKGDKWFDEEEPVGTPFYESLAPAKPACPSMHEGEQAFWDKVERQECSVILYDVDKHSFKFVGFVQRHYGESDSGTDMQSAVSNVQDKYGKQFIRSGRYNF